MMYGASPDSTFQVKTTPGALLSRSMRTWTAGRGYPRGVVAWRVVADAHRRGRRNVAAALRTVGQREGARDGCCNRRGDRGTRLIHAHGS